MTKPKKLTIFSPENDQFSTDFRLETYFCVVLKRFEAMFWCCSNRGKELSISKIYVSILDSTFSSRTTSKILEESESKKFDPKPAIKILNENVRFNRDRNRRRHQKKESKRQQNNLHFWNKILKKNSAAKNLRFYIFENYGCLGFSASSKQHLRQQNRQPLVSVNLCDHKIVQIQLHQQTIRCQVLAWLNKIWSCLIFIKLYVKRSLLFLISWQFQFGQL